MDSYSIRFPSKLLERQGQFLLFCSTLDTFRFQISRYKYELTIAAFISCFFHRDVYLRHFFQVNKATLNEATET